ncbi:asparagine synthase (glutamine-hydrolyzing) [Pendulispora brunnea]|uniref:asparagine synthase (glutamine-hydrolyzing) n=1 Tax=Pendulispora brunnea TaxID=2905690 RepID=A0ABZ2KLL0_9BACT
MCGIAGMYGARLPKVADETLAAMLRLIRHRGPNEAGVYLSERVCMGTVRLSIVGVATGQQPVSDPDERYFLCYNGEIYNYVELRKELKALGYRFTTESDTEVVLHAWQAWGTHCLNRFNGGFAFALYDRRQQALYLARDRYGKRPLFYTKHGANVLFGSEMKCFLAAKDFSFEFDPPQVASILTLWTPIGEQSGFKGIRQVPQGAYVKISESGPEIERYHRIDFVPPHEVRSESQAIEEVRDALQQAVALRLRSDVEVGMYLSGGLDSSILASVLKEQVTDRFRTYSVEFEDAEFDESADQRRMAAHVGSRHRTVRVTNELIAEHFPAAAFHAEVPVFRTAFVPMYLLSRMVRDDGIKVVITGEGADEAFLGYDLFKETLLRRAWSGLDDATKLSRLSRLYPYLKHYSGRDTTDLLGLYQAFSEERYPGLFSHELRIQNGLFSRRLLKGRIDGFGAIQQLLAEHPYFSAFSATEKAQWLEYQSLLPGYLLSSQGDRMALANSVENRCPFLDPNVVELSAAVNLEFDDGSDEKYLLRKAFEHALPAENLRKRKHPYRAPDSKAFVASRPDYLELLRSEHELAKNDLLDPRFCKLLVEKVFNAPAAEISTKENQTFIFLLSIALQRHQFVERNISGVAQNAPVDDLMVRRVDRRPRDASLVSEL